MNSRDRRFAASAGRCVNRGRACRRRSPTRSSRGGKSARNSRMPNVYALTTHWLLVAPIERVWDALTAPEHWPRWWRYVETVDLLAAGDAEGIGAVRRYVWSSRLPYRLAFDMTTTALERP